MVLPEGPQRALAPLKTQTWIKSQVHGHQHNFLLPAIKSN